MKQQLLICIYAISLTADAQNFQAGLPSENFFSPWCLHRSSINLLPVVNYNINTKGPLLNALFASSSSDPSVLLKDIFNKGNGKNYLYYQSQTSILDFRKKLNNSELGFGIDFISEGYMQSNFNVPFVNHSSLKNGERDNLMKAGFKINMNACAAVSYSFSYLKNVHKYKLKNYGFKIELLTGLNAIRGQLKSQGMNMPDTDNINIGIERKGFISRSTNQLHIKEFLPFYKNPGIAISYGLKWHVSNKNTWAVNLSNLGFIYFSRTKNNLHKGTDTLNLISETQPFNSYFDSLKLYGNRQNEAWYFLPFEINTNYNHNFNNHHSMLISLTLSPILKNVKASISFNKKMGNYRFIPSLNTVNFNRVNVGLGLLKNAKFISWGINLNFLSNTINLIKNSAVGDIRINNQNNIQAGLFVYYHFINRIKRQTSSKHKLIKTYLRE